MASRVTHRDSPHLFMMRGLPGSGKTKLAWKIIKEYDDTGVVLSTDDYFIDKYAEKAIQHGVHPIIIDNTNIRCRDMEPYVQMGYDCGYYVMFRAAPDTFRCSVEELHERANCGIPKWVMYRMEKNYERVKNIYDVIGYPEGHKGGSIVGVKEKESEDEDEEQEQDEEQEV